MKAFLRYWLARWWRALSPKPDHLREAQARLRAYETVLGNMPVHERAGFVRFSSIAQEMIEARLMAGSGPSFGSPAPELVREADAACQRVHDRALGLNESVNISSQGAFGDIELALANVEWRREISISWLEFSRWGIQQIILISRLYYIKNPLLRRAIDVCAVYVFGRGVEVTSTDPDANDVLKEFWQRNKKTLGPAAVMMHERAKYYDGNLFFAFFSDTEATGTTDCRMMDATEVQEVVTDPQDSSREILYKRVWSQRNFDASTGVSSYTTETRWYPALGFERQAPYGDTIGVDYIEWSTPVLHRAVGGIGTWRMGCPRVYPAIEWAKTAKEFLEACLTLAQSHAQIAWEITTKGGQAALQGIKSQIQTTVNTSPNNAIWDNNPTPVDASWFGSGPGTKIAPVHSRGQGLDPTEVKEYRNMVGMTVGIPPTWLGDMETSNLSTALTLDRPTELGFRAKQIEWEEDLYIIAEYVLSVSGKATNGKLREAWDKRAAGKVICITEAPRKTLKDGRFVYDEAAKPKGDEIQIRVTFPAIREGDLPALVKAIAEAMTLDNKGGQVVGIDEKVGVRLLLETFGVENAEEILAEMYPEKDSGKEGTPDYKPAYDPCRTTEPLPAPIGKAEPDPGGEPQLPGGSDPKPADKKVAAAEAA